MRTTDNPISHLARNTPLRQCGRQQPLRCLDLADVVAEYGVAAIRERIAGLRRNGEHTTAACIERELAQVEQPPW